MIKLEQIRKTFNSGKASEFKALRGIDLTLTHGTLTVFKGPSGSGKTTLLSIIGCMARPTSGRIWIDGRETTSLPERFAAKIRRHSFGFIFQNYHLIKGISVIENTMVPGYPEGQRYAALKDRAMDLLRRLAIETKARQKVEYLSGGEQQRVAIARALINNPSYVIADEPTAHLDTELALAFVGILGRLKAEGKTILVASHDPLVYQAPFVDRVTELRDGEVVQTENVI